MSTLRDPLFRGLKVIVLPKGGFYMKCMASCRRHGQRVEVRVASVEDARRWAENHRLQFAGHDTPSTRLDAASRGWEHAGDR